VSQAVVIGAGPNGLVAANVLAEAGWDVLVLEEQDRIGGAVYSDRSVHPDFVTDWFSAFYPLGAASPVITGLHLEDHGLRWSHAPAALAHVLPDDRCAVLSRDMEATVASLESFAAGDGAAWRRLAAEFAAIRDPLLRALFTPFPPVRGALALARALGAADLVRFLRLAVQPVRRAGAEMFAGEGAPLLLAGNALHTDLGPETAGSALYGWLLAMLGQDVGFPVPAGGSGALAQAMAARLRGLGGEIRTAAPVRRIEVSSGAAAAVVLADGTRIATRTVLADVSAPALFCDLLPTAALPGKLLDDVRRFEWDGATLKIDWALAHPVPWTAAGARGAGTVHLGVDMAGLTRHAADLATGTMPRDPFVIMGQMTTSDPSRSPAGTESAWAYTHIPPGAPAEAVAAQVRRVEEVIEARAPGFAAAVLARRVLAPVDLAGLDANLVDGAVNGGTASIHQQLIFRPVPGLGRAETPVDGVYLASASAHPGGGVHGAPGRNAAVAAIKRAGASGRLRRWAVDAALRRLYR
jgi:phytoene dehydrogenase-like protein